MIFSLKIFGIIQELKEKIQKYLFASNKCCFGYLLYKIITNNNPFTDSKKRKEQIIPNFELKSLIQKYVVIKPDNRPRFSN